jgi:hypothetical protein
LVEEEGFDRVILVPVPAEFADPAQHAVMVRLDPIAVGPRRAEFARYRERNLEGVGFVGEPQRV